MVVQSHEIPIRYLEENGKVKVRLNVRQEIKEDTVSYTYDEYVYETPLDIALGMSLKLIKQEYTEYTYDNLVEYYKASNVSDYDLLVQEYIDSQEFQIKINEAKQYLSKTDHKFFNGYKPKVDEDLVEIKILRDEARDFIRANS